MNPIRLSFFLCALLFSQQYVCAVPATQGAAGAALPTIEQLRQMEAGQQYQLVVHDVAVILKAAPDLTENDRTELDLIKAEAHVQLRSNEEARAAFAAAAAHASEPKRTALALAMAELVRKSPRMIYHRANPLNPGGQAPSQTFDLTQTGEEQRREALSALFDDEWTTAAPAAKRALATSQSLGPIFDFARIGALLRAIERAATGKSAQCDKLLGDILAHARELVEPALAAMKAKLDPIEKHAEKILDVSLIWDEEHNKVPGPTYTPSANGQVKHPNKHYRLAGFNGGDADTVHDIANQCQAITAGLAKLSASFGETANGSDKDTTESAAMLKRIEKLLNRDYTRIVSDPKELRQADTQ